MFVKIIYFWLTTLILGNNHNRRFCGFTTVTYIVCCHFNPSRAQPSPCFAITERFLKIIPSNMIVNI